MKEKNHMMTDFVLAANYISVKDILNKKKTQHVNVNYNKK